MKCSLGVSNFLEEISIFPILFFSSVSLITEEGFLISHCYSLEFCIQMGISFLFSLILASFLFAVIDKASSDSHVAFLDYSYLNSLFVNYICAPS